MYKVESEARLLDSEMSTWTQYRKAGCHEKGHEWGKSQKLRGAAPHRSTNRHTGNPSIHGIKTTLNERRKRDVKESKRKRPSRIILKNRPLLTQAQSHAISVSARTQLAFI